MKEILRRALEEGREGRVLMIQERLASARDIPPEHEAVLRQIKLFGQTVPQGSVFQSHMVH